MSDSVAFHFEDVDLAIEKPKKTKEWIKNIVSQEQFGIQSINFIFCGDEFLFNLNKKYLNHETYTDILTFDYSEGKNLVGDIYISIERVEDNSSRLRVDFSEELRRVMIHGILHLLGHNDKTSAQKASMRKREEACLSLFTK